VHRLRYISTRDGISTELECTKKKKDQLMYGTDPYSWNKPIFLDQVIFFYDHSERTQITWFKNIFMLFRTYRCYNPSFTVLKYNDVISFFLNNEKKK